MTLRVLLTATRRSQITRNVDSFSPSGPVSLSECMQWVVQLWQHLTVVTLHCVPTHTQTLGASWLRTGFSDQRSSSAKCDTDLWSSDWLNWHTRSLSLAGVCREKIQNMPHVLQLWGVFLAPEILPRVETSQWKLRREGKLQASENLWGSFPIFTSDTPSIGERFTIFEF